MDLQETIRALERKLASLDSERAAILSELERARKAMANEPHPLPELMGRPTRIEPPTTSPDKVKLFLELFRCREDIFPKRWENRKTGKQGYAPVCSNEWREPLCQKPKIKCSDCAHQAFLPLDEMAVESHLKGASTIGTYAVRKDDTTTFLACDFDETSWIEDIQLYKRAARELGVEVGIERSRSGNGGHAWIFFEEPIASRIARSLGTLILARCAEMNFKLGLDSYDRFFPSQDYLPRGGFGNLIALPLQKTPRSEGNSCFLSDSMAPCEDQWAHLSKLRRLSYDEARLILDQHRPHSPVVARPDAFQDIAWNADQGILEWDGELNRDESLLAGKVIEIEFGPMLQISLDSLPGRIVAKLRRTASFANPEFYKLQRMRMQTYPHQRFIFSGEILPDKIKLPRGVLDKVSDLLIKAGAKVIIRDERIAKKKIKVDFTGDLTAVQRLAVKASKQSDCGILVAPPGAGKTVLGCALIAERKVSTLILVHRQPLLEQWKERITQFLGVPPKEIGNLSGTKKKMTGRIDLAMLQTLTRMEDISEIAERYSQIIIDECHHIPAVSFEAILKQLPARYIVGLTATPYRKDGLEKILYQQCGPIRHEIKSIDGGTLQKEVTIQETGFRTPSDFGDRPPYHVVIEALTTDPARNQKVALAATKALSEGKFPLLISDRKEHLDLLAIEINEMYEVSAAGPIEIVRLDGDLSSKQRRKALERLTGIRNQGKDILLMATGSLIGEGFDLPELDTLILATPLSFEGRMVQYAGRIHRLAEGKKSVQILDFVDYFNAMLLNMYRNRLKAYRKMGYVINRPAHIMTGLAGVFSSTPVTAP